MPIRIYQLAKDLKIENKDLVDICSKVGIQGKGSALASLTDDEAAKVKAFLSGESAPEKPAKSAAKKPIASKPLAVKPGAKAQGSSAKTSSSGGLATTVAKKNTPADATPTKPGAITRDDSFIPPRKTDKIKVLGKGGKKPEAGKKKPEEDAPKTQPPAKEQRVRLAQMPEMKQPPAQPKEQKEKVQKPDIALPKDAIAASKKGKSAPLQRFTDSHKKNSGKEEQTSTQGNTGGRAGAGTGRGAAKTRSGEGTGKEGEGTGMGDLRRIRQENRKRHKQVKVDEEEPKPGTGSKRTPSRPMRRPRMATKGPRRNTAAPRKDNVVLELPCTVRTFSEAGGVAAVKLLFALANLRGIPPNTVNINSQIDEEEAHMLAEELAVEVEFKQQVSLEDELITKLDEEEDAPEDLAERPPVVTFLGHVDHGKTSLLDSIIGINVVSGEAGGITQHIRAYQVDKDGRKIAFVDTPGHEAFTEMRARGANVTDVAVLVVAADDGVMPQTEEAISHAKAAGVPIVVALNKMDLPGATPDKALQDLAARELLASEWGGDVEVIRTSAINGDGIDDLLETLLVTAELHEYKANPDRPAVGTCLEAEQEPGRGVIAKVMVQNGTLNVGDVVVCGAAHGRVKAMYDTLKTKKKVKVAGPSTPVNLTGLDKAPEAGDRFYVLDDISQAREIASRREINSREKSLSSRETPKVSFDQFQKLLEQGSLVVDTDDIVTLNLIIKADVRGSIEAIQKELTKISHPEVEIKILHQAVGGITLGDVTLANAWGAVIVGFNVIPTDEARAKAEQDDVEIRRYDVIYKVTEDVKATLEGRLKPEEHIKELGHALVKEVFQISRVGSIAGCHVTAGSIQRGCRIRVNRDGRTIGDYPLDSLRRHKEDVKEVPRGMECGIKLSGFNDVKEADVLEAYTIEEVARTL